MPIHQTELKLKQRTQEKSPERANTVHTIQYTQYNNSQSRKYTATDDTVTQVYRTERVETPEQMELLSKRGCTLMQGYLFSKPIRRDDFEEAVTAVDAEWRQHAASNASWELPNRTSIP